MGDEIDFDDLLADAEQEQDYDDDFMMDDIEAQLAMEAEASTTTPLSGSTSLGLGVGVTAGADAAGGDGPSAAAGVNRNHCPSPLPLEQRLGVSPREEGSPFSPLGGGTGGGGGGGDGDSDTLGEARRALNNDGRRNTSSNSDSPLHPVLKTDSSSRWSGNRSAPGEAGTAAAAGGRPTRGSRSQEHSSGAAGAASRSGRQLKPAAAMATAGVDGGGAVFSRPSMDGDSVAFMQSGGRMMHLKVRAAPTAAATSSMGGTGGGSAELTPPPPGGLLRTPMETLMERVTERRIILRSLETAAAERAAAAEREKDGEGAGVVAEEAGGSDSGGDGEGGGEGGGSKGRVGAGGALWVDKYAPEGFRDLLSDEKINREVLRAVKAWDPFVFKRESAKTAAVASEKKKAMGGMTSLHTGHSGDSVDKRPEARVIMLCGPPGLGKTTLAQVVARHAGYRVYEINASDDRTATVLRRRITEAMEGNTLLADKRPNLIVLDEVDGADGKAAAQVLVDIATSPLTKAGGGKKGKRRTPLTRPLVLICNDQWTPALRPVRAIAQVYVFKANSSPSRLVQRLKAICASERLTVNTDALTRLADRSHLDVRSCLNTLQFVARRAASGGVRNASAALLTAVAEGIKDERRDLFEVLRSVFTRKKSGAKRRLFLGGDQGSMADRKDADVFEEVQAFNDHGKVLAGVHENFLGVRFNDPTLCKKAAAAMDWLETADLMDARTNRTQDYSFSRYAPVAAAGVHFLCRSDQRTTVTHPKKDYEARTARAAKYNILHSFADGRQLGATGRTPEALVLDMLSHLMDVLAPTLRPLNPDLLSPQERTRFRGLVDVLLSCGLTFAPQSASSPPPAASAPYGAAAAAGAQEFALEPAIDQLLKYEGYDFAHPRLAPPLRPMVAHEVSLEAMRQAEASQLSHHDSAATGKNAAADPFAAAALDAARKAASPFVGGGSGDAASVEASSAASNSQKIDDKRDDTIENNGESDQAGGAAAVASKRKGRVAAETEQTKTKKTPAPSPPANKKFRENEKNRPVHPVPFWNRTNWIPGRKDGTGSRGGGSSGSGGNDTAATKNHRASEAAKDSTATDGIDGGRSSKRAACQVSGSSGTKEGSDSSSSSSLVATKNAVAAAGSSKRSRQEGERPAAAGSADGLVGGEVVKVPIRYQFRAGYTNAVRRPVRMRDLL
ncbi:unnamed protein product [Pylaiella littoralis]